MSTVGAAHAGTRPEAAGPDATVVRRYVLPGRRRRIVLLSCAAVAGVAAAGVAPQPEAAALLLAVLALAAGISSMWSP